jgi:hypothetical protein
MSLRQRDQKDHAHLHDVLPALRDDQQRAFKLERHDRGEDHAEQRLEYGVIGWIEIGIDDDSRNLQHQIPQQHDHGVFELLIEGIASSSGAAPARARPKLVRAALSDRSSEIG